MMIIIVIVITIIISVFQDSLDHVIGICKGEKAIWCVVFGTDEQGIMFC